VKVTWAVGCATDEQAVSGTLTGAQQGNGSGRAYMLYMLLYE